MVSIQFKKEPVKQKYHWKPQILNTTIFNAPFSKELTLLAGDKSAFFQPVLWKKCYRSPPSICIAVFTLPPSDCSVIFNSMTLLSFDFEHCIWKGFTASITFKTGLGSSSKPYVHNVCSISLTIFSVVRNFLSPIQDVSTDSRAQCAYCIYIATQIPLSVLL